MLQLLGESLIALLAPRRCPGCDLLDPDATGFFCAGCAPLLELIKLPEPGSRHSISLYRYGGPLQDAIVRLKFAGRSEIARTFAPDMRRGTAFFSGLIDAVVPVPLHPRRFRKRGFNQSALLARPVAKQLGVPMAAQLLRRVRYAAPRTQTSVSSRHAAPGTFVGRPNNRFGRILLVDDVRTTGATLRACALALRAAGAQRVYSLTLATS